MGIYLGDKNITGGFTTAEKKQFNNSINLINEQMQTKTDNNLTTTSKEVVGAINEVKILNDTKLNKTDANKLNCVTIDNVSLKEYILTNFTETKEKTYYLIAKTTCTDLPKASNFFITVETPGAYTYKVTAKELNDSNGSYVCTYRTISSSWTEWEKVLLNDDIIDNLTSTDTNKPLSANQGKVLKDEVDLKANDDEVLKKTDIVTTIDSSSTNNQVPSASAIYNNPKNKIKKLNSSESIIAYADTINNEMVTETVEILNIKDSPYGVNDASNDFYYTIYNIDNYNFKRIVAYDIRKNDMYMIMKKNGVWSSWEKVCTTTVADVPETPIEFDKTSLGLTISNNRSIYKVINGICYVTIELLVDAPSENKSYGYTKVNTTSLPKIGFNTKYIINVEGANSTISAILDKGTTEIKLHGNILAKEGTYIIQGSFSYPVAE